MSDKIQALLDQVKDMKVLELAEFVKAVEDEFGISASPAVATVASAGAATVVEEEKTEFNVILTETGGEKIKVIKVVREITGLGLGEAKALVDGAPNTVKEAVSKADAEAMKVKLEEVGAKVELK